MATKPKHAMTIDEYVKAYEGSTAGRHELVDGEVLIMAPETALHNRVKMNVFRVLEDAITAKSLPFTVFGDGMTLKIDNHTGREPDASVQHGTDFDPDTLYLISPVIVLEVISPSSERDDTGRKLVEYFSIASVLHYVVVDPWKGHVLHHQRSLKDKILSSILRAGDLEFDALGFKVSVRAFLGKQ